MKIMYIAPRYHTNQTEIMRGWVQNGHEVCFLSHYHGKIEDYAVVTPCIMGYSKFFILIEKIYLKMNKNKPQAVNMKLKLGFPPFFKLSKKITEFNPDLIILRERSVYSICAYAICRRKGYPSILYNQSPLWEDRIKNDPAHRLVRGLLPKIRMTPVLGAKTEGKVKEPNAFFVPFIVEKRQFGEEKVYCKDGIIRIFCVGKYEKRKNQAMLINVCAKLSKRYALQLTVAGECSNGFHEVYYDSLRRQICDNHLDSLVKLLINLTREEMNHEYKTADVFVIPSTLEPASVSQLEAMAFSLPVICSDTNGTACYVEDGQNGYLFQDNNAEDLSEKLEHLIGKKDNIEKMGRKSGQLADEKYQFKSYYEGIVAMRSNL